MAKKNNKLTALFEAFATRLTKLTGNSAVFIVALIIVIVWGICGPVFHYSDTWQLVINTGTTIITFLMVFIIQHSQNKDTIAIHLKLNELIASQKTASNRLIAVEDLTEQELETLKTFYTKLAILSKKDNDLFTTHSIDEAENIHDDKKDNFGRTKKQDDIEKTIT